MNIVIIGAGALGSHLVLLGRNWDAQLTVVDFDRVERKNTLSQLHSRQGVGRNKAQALAQAMQGLFGLRLRALPHRLSEDNVEAVFEGAQLIVDCTDNAPTRRLIAARAEAAGVPCLHGALAADGAYGRVMWSERFSVDAGGEGEATCEDGEHLPFIAFVAARMAMTVQRFLKDGERRDEHLHPGGVTAL